MILRKHFLLLLTFIVPSISEYCGIDEKIDLSTKSIIVSSLFNSKEVHKAVDGDLSTSVTTVCESNSKCPPKGENEINWFAVQVGGDGDYRFVKSVVITPARPKPKMEKASAGDERNTSACVFPFSYVKSPPVYRCEDLDNIGFPWCCLNEDCSNGWSSCDNSGQPDGNLTDNIEVLLTSSNVITDSENKLNVTNFVSCGDSGSGLYNADREISCHKNITNAKYIILRKKEDVRFSLLKVSLYKHNRSMTIIDRSLTIPKETWIENEDVILKIQGCKPNFIISSIIWFHETFDNTTVTEIGRINQDETEINLSNIQFNNSGKYYFKYQNQNGEHFFKSNILSRQVKYKSTFSTQLANVEGLENNTITIKCAVTFGFPHPDLKINIGQTNSICQFQREENRYGGQSVSCTSNITLIKEMNNSTLTCMSEQNGDFHQVSTAVIKILRPPTTSPAPDDRLPLHLLIIYITIPVATALVTMIIITSLVIFRRRKTKEGTSQNSNLPHKEITQSPTYVNSDPSDVEYVDLVHDRSEINSPSPYYEEIAPIQPKPAPVTSKDFVEYGELDSTNP